MLLSNIATIDREARAMKTMAANLTRVGADWMPATGIRSLMMGDPCMTWLQFHGKAHGFRQDPEEYSFLSFIANKGRGFEAAWASHNCPEAPRVIFEDWDVRNADSVKLLIAELDKGTPIIWKCPLWAPEARVYGTADFLALRSWIDQRYPGLLPKSDAPDHYLPIELKFTSQLGSPEKKDDLALYRNQLRIYAYMVGAVQGHMPKEALIITRDSLDIPIVVDTGLDDDSGFPSDLADLRDTFVDIKINGANYLPWRDAIVRPLIGGDSAPWNDAKKLIAREKIEGRALELMHQISAPRANILKSGGVTSLRQLINEPQHWRDLAILQGVGKSTHAQMVAILEANRSGRATPIPAGAVPHSEIEVYVDYEYFSSINVDFEREWPDLNGKEMVFAVGVGYEVEGEFHYKSFFAQAETHEAETAMFKDFLAHLDELGVFKTKSAALYHWTNAEVWQTRKAATRTGTEQLSKLPWVDLQKPFLTVPIGIPGCFEFGLKPVAKALGHYAPEFKVEWPDGLCDGLAAQVMSWCAYAKPDPVTTDEIALVDKYLEIDVKAMWQVLRWMRAVAT